MRVRQILPWVLLSSLSIFTGCTLSGGTGASASRGDEPAVRSASAGGPPASPRRSDERDAAGQSPAFKFAAAYPTGLRESSVLLLEADAPAEARIGSTFNYTVRVTNLTNQPLRNVRAFDVEHPRDRERSAAGDEAGAPSTRPAALADGWDVGALAPHESKSRQFSVGADQVGTMHTCFAASYTIALCTAVRITKPELRFTLEGPTDVLICEPITRKYVVTNVGTGTAEAVRVTDELPDGLATQDDQRRVSINLGDVRAGETKSLAVSLRATRTGDFASHAWAASGDDLRAESAALTTAVRQPVLAVTVVAPESRYAGEPIDYRVSVRNTGDGPARQAALHLAATGADVDARLADRDLGTIAPGQAVTQVIALRAPPTGGKVSLNATVDAHCAETAGAGAAVRIITVPALLLECNDSIDPVRVGNTTIYTITVTNQGTGADTNVKLHVTVPDEESFADGRGDTPIHADGHSLTMEPVATLAPKQAVQWKVECRGAKPGDARFNVELTSDSLTRPATKSESTRVVGDVADPAAPAPAEPR